ncbi:MAG: isoprenylcysteine carboxylmethyltransferase family protein, partial [Candidatus Eisenbacteria bacterium]
VMLAWVGFTLAFVVFKPKTPAAAPAQAAETRTVDRRSLGGVLLQALGYFLMWLSFLPPFPTLSLLPRPLAPALAVVAVALAWASASFAFWAQRTLGKEWSFQARLVEGHRLVTDGPYAIVRHPIYAAMCGLWLATGLAIARPWGIVLGGVPMIAGTWLRVKLEDALLRGAFGETFEAWAKRVPAVVPKLLG